MNDNNDLNTLIEKLTAIVDRAANRRFLGVAGAANHASLSIESIRRLIKSGRLTALRPVRGKIVIDVHELDAVIRSSTTSPRTGRGRRSNQ